MTTRNLGNDKTCRCKKARARHLRENERKSKPKELIKRKRQTFVYNPEEITWAEPYMHSLGRQFSEESIACDSKIELPWKDIALRTKGMKIRGDALKHKSEHSIPVEESPIELEVKESSDTMALPWKDLLVSDTIQSHINKTIGIDQCDSKLEIPWDILALDAPVKINPFPEKETCIPEDVEIPWNDLMIPANLIIEADKIIKHPSNRYSSRSAASTAARGCPPCLTARK